VQYPAAIAPNMYFVLISAEAAAPGQAPGSNAPPKAFEISQNFPNPFRLRGVAPHTVVECYLKEENRVVVTIYNTLGQVIRILHDGVLAAGSHRMTWDGRDENHESVPSGKYLYAMEIREEMQQGPFVLTSALTRETKVMTILK